MIDISIPLSEIEFSGTFETNGTNGTGDFVYISGQSGFINLNDYPIDANLVYDEDGNFPDTVDVRIRLSL